VRWPFPRGPCAMDPAEFLWSAERRDELDPAVLAAAGEREAQSSNGQGQAHASSPPPMQRKRPDSVGAADTLATAAAARRHIE
jgi:hypothetical protein